MLSCCSFKSLAILVGALAVFIKVGNPLLDGLIAPVEEKPERQAFVVGQTDVLNLTGFGFLNVTEDEMVLDLGLSYILRQSFPRWLVALLSRGDTFDAKTENHTVDILDARKRSDELSFYRTGFTLVQLDEASKTTNWRSQEDVKHFQDELTPHLEKLYPQATRFVYTYSVVRGGNHFGDQPPSVNGPHLDYSQNDSARVDFHEQYPQVGIEQSLLLGRNNTNDEHMETLLGIWKPILMSTPVCDLPLAVMDASTFRREQERLFRLHFDFGVSKFHNLNGAIQHNEEQQWYYYPFQTDTEVLVFTQYSKGRHFANPHGAFVNPNCPENYGARISIEMRAAVFVPTEKVVVRDETV